jgi:hypothetical protein
MHAITLTALLAVVAAGLSGCAAPEAPVSDDLAPDRPDLSPPAGQGMADEAGATGSDQGTAGPRNMSDGPAGAALPEPAWAPLADATIHPGIQTFTEGAQCTANFVFYAANGTGFDLYIGQAAHCAGTGAATDTNGCTAESLPLGTKVDLGTGNPGVLAYSSWLAMQAAKTPDSAAECLGNDFALVRIAEADEASVNPEVPFFGGPTGIAPTAELGTGESVYSFGNSGLRFGVEPVLSWKHGNVVSSDAWVADVYTATPGIPGDSGSGFLTADGKAFGVLSTVAVLPLPLSNQVSGLASALDYMSAHDGPGVELGTAPWTGGIAG